MKRSTLLPSAYVFDLVAGDPEWFPHPVRWIGAAIARGESILRRDGQPDAVELGFGAILTTAIVAGAYCGTAAMIRSAYRRSRVLGNVLELGFAWTCLAARNLQQETVSVTNALDSGDLLLARGRLARIVGRDTVNLDAEEVSRAVIETAAESASDGIIAPLFYMAIGGAPLAMAYKAVNTLDSMIGHADSRYFYFGKAAARLDDIANYLPARLTALGVIAVASVMENVDAKAALRTWKRDGGRHKSPNAGQPESAMAGALRVRLGGANTYAGELVPAETIGEEFPAPSNDDARRAIKIVSLVALLGVGFGVLFASSIGAAKRT